MRDRFHFHRRSLPLAGALCLSLLLLSACASQPSGIKPGTKEATLFVASDLHLYSEELLSPGNQLYIKENFSSDGRIPAKTCGSILSGSFMMSTTPRPQSSTKLPWGRNRAQPPPGC